MVIFIHLPGVPPWLRQHSLNYSKERRYHCIAG